MEPRKRIQSGGVNIVLIITKGDIGGAQIHVKDLAVSLQELNNQVTVLVGEKDTFTAMLDELGVPYRVLEHLVREINPARDVKAFKEIRYHLRDIQPDLVSLHSSKVGILGRIATTLEKIPATFTAHGWAFTGGVNAKKRFVYRTVETLIAMLPVKIIAVSNYDRNLALTYKVCKPDKITMVHNGMPDIPPSLYADPSHSPPRLIMVARFKEPKDHLALVRALNELKHLNWELILVGGDAGLLATNEQEIAHLGLKNKIKILGYRDDIDKLIASSQIFVLISRWEGFPLTILEAMRAKLPVIASNVGGVSESIVEGETGFLVDNHEQLVARLEALITDPDKREKMGNKGRESYQKNFTLEKQLEETFAIYDELLAKSL